MKRAPRSAGKLVVLENSDPISAETEAIQNRIRHRAFELSTTRPADAHALYDWIMAESEVISVPPTELIEKNGRFEIRIALAGVRPDDVQVMVTPEQILVKSELTHQHDSDNGTVLLCDFKSATLFRTLTLPAPVDVDSVRTDFEDGILSITAERLGAERPAQTERVEPVEESTLAPPSRKIPAKKSRSRLP